MNACSPSCSTRHAQPIHSRAMHRDRTASACLYGGHPLLHMPDKLPPRCLALVCHHHGLPHHLIYYLSHLISPAFPLGVVPATTIASLQARTDRASASPRAPHRGDSDLVLLSFSCLSRAESRRGETGADARAVHYSQGAQKSRMKESASRCPLVQIEMTILLEAQVLIDRISHRR